jgi:hypothetical protein
MEQSLTDTTNVSKEDGEEPSTPLKEEERIEFDGARSSEGLDGELQRLSELRKKATKLKKNTYSLHDTLSILLIVWKYRLRGKWGEVQKKLFSQHLCTDRTPDSIRDHYANTVRIESKFDFDYKPGKTGKYSRSFCNSIAATKEVTEWEQGMWLRIRNLITKLREKEILESTEINNNKTEEEVSAALTKAGEEQKQARSELTQKLAEQARKEEERNDNLLKHAARYLQLMEEHQPRLQRMMELMELLIGAELTKRKVEDPNENEPSLKRKK